MKACLAVAVLVAGLAQAQQTTPHAGYVYPAGGRQGATLQVTLGGQYLDGVNNAYVSGAGVSATVVKLVKPMPQMKFNELNDQVKELVSKRRQAGAAWSPDDEKKLNDLRETLATAVRRPANPSIGQLAILEITISPDAPAGPRELRVATPAGMTNPIVFCVGQLPEVAKKPMLVIDEFKSAAARYRNQSVKTDQDKAIDIQLPAVVNGQINPGGVDTYKFQAKKGQRLVIAASARELIPYISDAVPGWFQATLTLCDPKGKEVDYAGNFRFHQDPVILHEVPADGEYTLQIHDSIYRGREDFVYRIELGELPYVTGIFPLGGRTGAKTTVELQGWNLPVSKLTMDDKKKPKGVYPISVSKGEWTSNRVPFAVDALPEIMEKASNHTAKTAQKLKLPVMVNGRIARPGDRDVFRFDGKAGEEVVAEVVARRLDSPLDSILKLTNAAGKQLCVNDDFDDKGAGLLTHQADSRILFKLPATGTYYLYLSDTQDKGGPEYAYRLRVSHPQPDFELRVTPASINARTGANIPITVYALRRDGFNGEIALKLKDAPAGFSLAGGVIPAGQDQVRLTLTVPASHIEKPRPIALEGRAAVQGKEVGRLAVPAEDMMQAFAYRHLVAQKDWLIRVTGYGRSTATSWKFQSDKPVLLHKGGAAPVHVVIPSNGRAAEQVQLALNEPPDGIAIKNVSIVKDGVAMTLVTDPAKVKPGMRGNLIVDAFLERATDSKKRQIRRIPVGSLPALPFEIVP